MTRGKVWHYPYFVRLFHTSTPLKSVELSKEWQGSWLGKKWDVILTLSDYSTLPHFWEAWNLRWERKVGLFHTSTPQRSVELRMKKESRDLVASAGHLWSSYFANGTGYVCEGEVFLRHVHQNVILSHEESTMTLHGHMSCFSNIFAVIILISIFLIHFWQYNLQSKG